jgi:hypothetical protein
MFYLPTKIPYEWRHKTQGGMKMAAPPAAAGAVLGDD